jgi:hypothetical protein
LVAQFSKGGKDSLENVEMNPQLTSNILRMAAHHFEDPALPGEYGSMVRKLVIQAGCDCDDCRNKGVKEKGIIFLTVIVRVRLRHRVVDVHCCVVDAM